MAHLELHCRDCEAILGDRHEAVNRWIDELFSLFGPQHRRYRHHWRGVREAEALFGKEGARAAIVHIVRDCGGVPTDRSYDEMKPGIVIAQEYLTCDSTNTAAQSKFVADVRKELEKFERKQA
jgi:hypothetical protein